MIKKYAILFNLKNYFLIAFFFLSITANPQNFIFKHLTTNEGLSSGNVWSIIQDSKGYLWFGTEDGLNKYDPYKFTVYRNDPTDSTSISDNWIRCIVEDSNALWISTRNGLNRYSYQSDNFKKYFNNESDSDFISNFAVNSVIKDRKGQIWVGTNFGLSLYDRKKDKFIRYASLPKNSQQTGSNQVRSITIDANGLFWLSTMDGIYQFDPLKKLFTRYLNDLIIMESFGSSIIHCTFIDTKKNIWIGTEFAGLFYFDIAINKLYHYTHNPTDPHSLCNNQVNNIMEDNNGNIWISTNGGLSYVKHGTNLRHGLSIFNSLNRDPKYNGLSTNNINTTYLDKNNRLWVGGRFGDIDIIDNQDKQFLSYKFTDIESNFSSNNMTTMVEDGDGNIWFGTDGGGIYFWDRKNNKYKVYKNNYFNKASLTSNKVIALCIDSYRNLWIGMWNGGIDKLDLKNDIYTHYRYNPADINSLASDNVYSITEDSQKNIWIGMWFGGLNLYDRKHDYFTRFPYGVGDSTIMSGAIVLCIYEDRNNNLWIGSETDGLNLLNKKNNTFKKYKHNKNDSSSLSNNGINCIYEDSHNRLWVGTKGGLNLFNSDKQTFRRFTISDGLPNNIVCWILEDRKGNLWLSTNNGISRVSIRENQNNLIVAFKNFDQFDGLQNRQFNLWSGLKTKRGELIFGGINGVSIFHPDSIQENITVPPIVITEFSLFNKPVPIGKQGSPLMTSIGETKKITLSYKQSVISFGYAALNYINSEKNKYAYKMEGFEKDWNYVGNQRKATYTNLDPGKYIFRVIGSNNDGIWNEKGVSLQIIILPPWWNTWWFKLIIISAIIFIVASIFLSRVQRLKNQKILLEKLVVKKTTELYELNASKDKFFSIIAHDLKNPFNTIIGFSEMLNEEIKSGDSARIEEYSGMINISAVQTLRLLENLLEWAKSQTGKLLFNPVPINLSGLFNEEFSMLNDMAKGKNIELKSSFPADLTVLADKNMLKTILRNLISNSIKFTHRNGKVEVKAIIDNKQVEISVSDSGIGMTKETTAKLFRIDANLSTQGTENEKGTGLGLILCKEFVEKNGGKIWVESESGKGSTFKFILPLVSNHSL